MRLRPALLILAATALAAAVVATVMVFPERYAQLGFRRLDAYVCPEDAPWAERLQRVVDAAGRWAGLNRRQRPSAAQADPGTPELRRPGLVLSTVAAGLEAPTTLAFLEDNTFLILEKNTGHVKYSRNGTARTVSDLAVNFNNERGALGITVHPRVRDNGFVYLFWTWRGTGAGPGRLNGADSRDPLDTPRRGNRIDRFRWAGETLTFDRNIVTLPSVAAPLKPTGHTGVHNGGILVFDARGKMYAVIGDSALGGQLQNIKEGAPPTDDYLAGVILRLNDDGTTPEDNPFYRVGRSVGGAAGRNLQRVFAYGIRNSFGMAFDPVTGTLWMSENGLDLFDEINRVPPGFNSRWTQIMGPVQCYRAYQLERRSKSPLKARVSLAPTARDALARLYDLPGSQPLDPAFSWRVPVAPTAVTFASLIDKRIDLFVGDVHGHVYRFELSSDRNRLFFEDRRLADGVANNRDSDRAVETESLIIGRNFGIVSDLKVAPDGSLYVVSLTHGKVYSISRR